MTSSNMIILFKSGENIQYEYVTKNHFNFN